MENENENEKKVDEVENQNDNKSDVDLAKELIEARKSSVKKSDYDKLVAERDKILQEKNDLLKSIIDGDKIERSDETPITDEEIAKKRKDLENPDLTNLVYWEAALDLRDAVLEKDGYDCFADPGGENGDKAQLVADTVKECIAQANGDDEVFIALLNGKIQDDPIKPKPTNKPRRG